MKKNFLGNRKRLLTTCVVLLCFSVMYPQSSRKEDLACWSWIQVEKKIKHNQYLEFQYQLRLNNNSSAFDRSNLYLIYGKKLHSQLNMELLYQLNTNYKNDQHTIYLGLSYKQPLLPRLSVTFRSAVQNTRNYYTGDDRIDKPYSEWRNRARVNYAVNRRFRLSLSAEPYLLFKPSAPIYFSRIRYVNQLSCKYNKYQDFTAFYLLQPDIITHSRPKTMYVMGLAYHVTLPDKLKNYKKLFRFKRYKEKDDPEPDDRLLMEIGI